MELPKKSLEKIRSFNDKKIIYKGINVLIPSQIFAFEYPRGTYAKGLTNFFKKFSLDNYIKGFIFLVGFKRKKSDYHKKVVFINDVFNQSMIKNLRNVQSTFDNKDFEEVIIDKRVKNNNSISIYRFFKPIRFFIKDLPNAIKGFYVNQKYFKELSEEFNTKKRLYFMSFIETFFLLNCVEGLIKKYNNLDAIVLNTDIHKVSRLFVLAGKKQKIKTIVLQHGATVLEFGYLPVYADHMCVWGELSKKWFVERGVPESKLLVTGTPKMDFVQKYDISKSRISDIKKILVIMNPIGKKNMMFFLETISNAISELGDVEITIKLHPSADDYSDLPEKFFMRKVNICKFENIHELLYQTDVVITTTSTVGSESIAFYKPLIQIRLENYEGTRLDYENMDCCLVVENQNDLASILSNKTLINSKILNYQNYIEKCFYKLDGNSAERIKEVILN